MRYTQKDVLEMFKALSNEARLSIMEWLANPDTAFAGLEKHDAVGLPDWGGVCVGTIQEKAGLSQSTVSAYLQTMHKAHLLECARHEKWTYYRVNREAVDALAEFLQSWSR